MSGVFATKWDFLYASVLLGIDRTTGVFSGSEATPGRQMVCVWTSEQMATEALHVESWELRQIEVRDLLMLLPDGVGVVVDPERSTGMTASPAYVANLKRYVPAFPVGTQVQVGAWEAMPRSVRTALADAVTGLAGVREVHAFAYAVDEGPPRGCIAHRSDGHQDASTITRSLESALRSSAEPVDLDVAAVHVLALDDVPEEIRSALAHRHLIHRRRRPRLSRR